MSTQNLEKVYNHSPLHIAVQNSDIQAVITLLADTTTKLEARNSKGRTPLHCVTSYKIVKDLLAAGANINALDKNGDTPLHVAILTQRVPVVQVLLQSGADVTLKNSYKGDTPLHIAVDPSCRHATMVQLLMKSGAQANEPNNFGETSLHVASKNNTSPIDRSIIKILMDHGADISLLNCAGKKAAEHKNSALHDAVALGETAGITKILMSKTDINYQDVYGRTALYEAVCKRGIESGVIRNLILAGSNVNLSDARDNTPLHEAIIVGNLSITRLLLNAGAQINRQNKQGDTALHLAVKAGYRKAFRGYAAIVKVLIDSDADVTLKNNENKIAVDYAKLDNIKKIFG